MPTVATLVRRDATDLSSSSTKPRSLPPPAADTKASTRPRALWMLVRDPPRMPPRSCTERRREVPTFAAPGTAGDHGAAGPSGDSARMPGWCTVPDKAAGPWAGGRDDVGAPRADAVAAVSGDGRDGRGITRQVPLRTNCLAWSLMLSKPEPGASE